MTEPHPHYCRYVLSIEEIAELNTLDGIERAALILDHDDVAAIRAKALYLPPSVGPPILREFHLLSNNSRAPNLRTDTPEFKELKTVQTASGKAAEKGQQLSPSQGKDDLRITL